MSGLGVGKSRIPVICVPPCPMLLLLPKLKSEA